MVPCVHLLQNQGFLETGVLGVGFWKGFSSCRCTVKGTANLTFVIIHIHWKHWYSPYTTGTEARAARLFVRQHKLHLKYTKSAPHLITLEIQQLCTGPNHSSHTVSLYRTPYRIISLNYRAGRHGRAHLCSATHQIKYRKSIPHPAHISNTSTLLSTSYI